MSESPHSLYQAHCSSVYRLSLRTIEGDESSGTAFHIGGGCLATAKHNLTDAELENIGDGYRTVNPGKIHLHEDSRVDLAVIETDLFHPEFIQVGGHLDDWIDDRFVMTKAVLMGYPPIPLSTGPVLVGVEVEVNAVINRYDGPYAHFIVSAVPRGGFSGGPVFSELGFLLGVMTSSLFKDGKSSELGFAAAVSVEPLLEIIHTNRVPCAENLVLADELFG